MFVLYLLAVLITLTLHTCLFSQTSRDLLPAGAVSLSSYLSDIPNVISNLSSRDGAVVTLRNVAMGSGGSGTTARRGASREKGFNATQAVTAKLQAIRIPFLASPLYILRFKRASRTDQDTAAAIARIDGEVHDDTAADSPRGLGDQGSDAGGNVSSGAESDVAGHSSDGDAEESPKNRRRSINTKRGSPPAAASAASSGRGRRGASASASGGSGSGVNKRVAFKAASRTSSIPSSRSASASSGGSRGSDDSADEGYGRRSSGGAGVRPRVMTSPIASGSPHTANGGNLRQRQRATAPSARPDVTTTGTGTVSTTSKPLSIRKPHSGHGGSGASASSPAHIKVNVEVDEVPLSVRKKDDDATLAVMPDVSASGSGDVPKKTVIKMSREDDVGSAIGRNKPGSIKSGGSGRDSATSATSLTEMLRRGIASRSTRTDSSLLRLQRAVFVVFLCIAAINVCSVVVSRILFDQLIANFRLVFANGERGVNLQRSYTMLQLLTLNAQGLYSLPETEANIRGKLWGSLDVIEDSHKMLYMAVDSSLPAEIELYSEWPL